MVRTIIILLVILAHGIAFAWTPIVGIPDPGFGIDETAPSLPSPWSSNTTGFYFVETGGANSGNGYPASPRGSMPSSPPAGSVIVIGGTFTGSEIVINYTGESGNPIWIIPEDASAEIIGKWYLQNASYVIFDGLKANYAHTSSPVNAKIEVYPTTHHVTFKNMTLVGSGSTTSTSNLDDDHQTIFAIQNPSSGYDIHHLVFYNNTMSLAGNWLYEPGNDPDAHGIAMGVYVENVWIIDNDFSYMSGDAVQVGAGTNGGNLDNTNARHIYVGGNVAHHICQAAFWAKQSDHVVMSSNTSYTLRRDCPSSPNSPGFGGQYGPKNFWIINNTVYAAQGAVAIASDSIVVDPGITSGITYIAGNNFYDIHDETSWSLNNWRSDAEVGYGTAILIRGTLGVYIVNNTIDDYDAGIMVASTIPSVVDGNILSSHNTGVDYVDIFTFANSVGDNVFNYNNIEGTIWVKNEGTTYTDISTIPGTGNVSTAPGYTNKGGRDYTLGASSGMIGAGGSSANAIYSTFQTAYSLDIKKDISGVTRPQNTTWDIGAYEYNEAVAPHSRGTVLLGQ